MANIESFAPAYGQAIVVTPGNTSATSSIPVNTTTLCITSRNSVECFIRVGTALLLQRLLTIWFRLMVR